MKALKKIAGILVYIVGYFTVLTVLIAILKALTYYTLFIWNIIP